MMLPKTALVASFQRKAALPLFGIIFLANLESIMTELWDPRLLG